MINVGDVIWIYAGTLRNPKQKMHVCVCVDDGYFFRINTKSHFGGSFPISRDDHPFLKWDSNLECGGVLEVAEFEIEESVRKRGVHGRLNVNVAEDLVRFIAQTPTLTLDVKNKIVASLKTWAGLPSYDETKGWGL